MTDRSPLIPAVERAPASIPLQREGGDTPNPLILTDISQVAEFAMRDLVVVGNRTVYGLLGNCDQEGNIQGRVEEVKGEGRRNRPLGLTIPFDHKAVVDIFDTRHMDRQLREFMEPDKLTELLGALAFVRAAAHEDINLPPCVISKPTGKLEDPDHDRPLAQVYSPKGNRVASAIIGLMTDQGGLPIMSSANKSGEPSITTTAKALEFAKEHNLPILVDKPDSERDAVQESYLVIHVGGHEIFIPRPGWMHEDIVDRVFYGLPRAKRPFTYPNPRGVLRLEHVIKKYPYAERYRGVDMSNCLREYLEIG